METNIFINALFLCLVNVAFMVVGIFLNTVVIISLWRSSQLRKKLCYFMILVLSCFDLAVVAIAHPLLILSTILWSIEIYHGEIEAGHTDIIYKYTFGRFFNVCAINADYRTIPGPNLSIFSSNCSHQRKTFTFSGIFDDHNSQFAATGIFLQENRYYSYSRVYFIPLVRVRLLKLQNVYHRQVKTQWWKGFSN